MGERVNGHDRVDERASAAQLPCRDHRRRHRHAVDLADLVGEEPPAMHAQARMPPVVALGDEHLRLGVGRSAPGVEQLGRGVAAEHAPAPNQHVGRSGPQAVRQLEPRVDVHVGEQPEIARPAQLLGGDEAVGDRPGPTERGSQHVRTDGSRGGAVPDRRECDTTARGRALVSRSRRSPA